jgi:rhodanese-related sulfurtransferase
VNELAWEISPHEVKKKLDAGEALYLIDVREPAEHQISRIEGAKLVPMRLVPASFQHIEGLGEVTSIVVFCHHGVRSLQVVNWLREQGVRACQSMAGGIDRWSLEVDPTVPRY